MRLALLAQVAPKIPRKGSAQFSAKRVAKPAPPFRVGDWVSLSPHWQTEGNAMYGPMESTSETAQVTAMLDSGDETVQVAFDGKDWTYAAGALQKAAPRASAGGASKPSSFAAEAEAKRLALQNKAGSTGASEAAKVAAKEEAAKQAAAEAAETEQTAKEAREQKEAEEAEARAKAEAAKAEQARLEKEAAKEKTPEEIEADKLAAINAMLSEMGGDDDDDDDDDDGDGDGDGDGNGNDDGDDAGAQAEENPVRRSARVPHTCIAMATDQPNPGGDAPR